jgi:hypothetical protein
MAWTVTPEGYGPLRAGMALSEVSRAVNEHIVVPSDTMNGGCGYIYPKVFPAGVGLMIRADTIVRVDVDTLGVVTQEGIGVGDSEERVLATYGSRISIAPHPYEGGPVGPDGHYLIVRGSTDTLHRIIFETQAKRVFAYRAGRRPEVDLIEGCS